MGHMLSCGYDLTQHQPPSADEGVAGKGEGLQGDGAPMRVGVDYTCRDYCDGQSLASPGGWPVEKRRYSEGIDWLTLAHTYLDFTALHGAPELLTMLALGTSGGLLVS